MQKGKFASAEPGEHVNAMFGGGGGGGRGWGGGAGAVATVMQLPAGFLNCPFAKVKVQL